MKLGLSQACYRWVFYPHLRRDTAAFRLSGERLPYFFSGPVVVDDGKAVEWLLRRCGELGLQSLYATAEFFESQAHAADMRRFGADQGVTIISGANANWVARADEWVRERERYISAMPIAVAAGATILCTTHAASATHNHFTKSPPIEQQIDIMVQNFADVAPVAADHGLVIAFENHQDYRASEIARVIEGVGSKALRANFDTANPVSVIEDPLDAANSIACHAVMAHLKDFRIQASTVIGEPRILWCPIGRGNVELKKVLRVLQNGVPDPANFHVSLEVAPPPDDDPDLWVRDSIDWTRKNLGEFFA